MWQAFMDVSIDVLWDMARIVSIFNYVGRIVEERGVIMGEQMIAKVVWGDMW